MILFPPFQNEKTKICQENCYKTIITVIAPALHDCSSENKLRLPDFQKISSRLQSAVTSYLLFIFLRLFSQIPVINDDLPFKILSGSVLVKPNLKEIRGSTVVFDDGSTAENVRGKFDETSHNLLFL